MHAALFSSKYPSSHIQPFAKFLVEVSIQTVQFWAEVVHSAHRDPHASQSSPVSNSFEAQVQAGGL